MKKLKRQYPFKDKQSIRARMIQRNIGLTPRMKTAYNYVLKTGIVPLSWREAVISVIPKEGKDKLVCGSYWSINVLNQDYNKSTTFWQKGLKIFFLR